MGARAAIATLVAVGIIVGFATYRAAVVPGGTVRRVGLPAAPPLAEPVAEVPEVPEVLAAPSFRDRAATSRTVTAAARTITSED